MSNEHTFTMTDRQKKRHAVEQYNLKYERDLLAKQLASQDVHTGKSVTTDTLLDHLRSHAKIDPQDLPDSVEITPVVLSVNEEFQAIGRSQRDNAGRRVVVLGTGGSSGLGRNVAQRLAFASPSVLADMGKQQAREEICQLLINEGSQEKFVNYLANLSGVQLGDIPLRTLKLPKLNEVDPKEIMKYAEMYETAVRDAHGLLKQDGGLDKGLLKEATELASALGIAETGFTPTGRAAKQMLSQMALTKAVQIVQDKLY